MFPFNLTGPDFLAFFIPFTGVLVVAVILIRRAMESGPVPRLKSIDPYVLAYLRGGEGEVLRVAVVSLVDRGLVEVNGARISRSQNADPRLVRRLIERVVLERTREPVEATALQDDEAVIAACEEYDDELMAAGLLPDAGVRTRRRILLAVVAFIFLGTAFTKMAIGLNLGRPIEILVLLTIVGALVLGWAACSPTRTRLGDLVLADMQSFFRPLRERAGELKPGGADADLVMLAGVFGLAALPAASFGYTRQLYPEIASTGGTPGTGCGSACGSSCGGGGCGGGCGGCGGG